MLKRLGLVLVACAFSVAANAQGVATEINMYRYITVTLSENAHRCELKDRGMFQSALKNQLDKLGLKQTDQSVLTANVAISGNTFGLLDGRCTYHVSLSFLAVLDESNLANLTPQAEAAIAKLQQVPVVLYRRGLFGTEVMRQPTAGGPAIGPRDAVLKGIERLAERFAEDRKG